MGLTPGVKFNDIQQTYILYSPLMHLEMYIRREVNLLALDVIITVPY